MLSVIHRDAADSCARYARHRRGMGGLLCALRATPTWYGRTLVRATRDTDELAKVRNATDELAHVVRRDTGEPDQSFRIGARVALSLLGGLDSHRASENRSNAPAFDRFSLAYWG